MYESHTCITLVSLLLLLYIYSIVTRKTCFVKITLLSLVNIQWEIYLIVLCIYLFTYSYNFMLKQLLDSLLLGGGVLPSKLITFMNVQSIKVISILPFFWFRYCTSDFRMSYLPIDITAVKSEVWFFAIINISALFLQ